MTEAQAKEQAVAREPTDCDRERRHAEESVTIRILISVSVDLNTISVGLSIELGRNISPVDERQYLSSIDGAVVHNKYSGVTMESIAIDRFAGSELDITGIRLLTSQEIEAVAGGEYDVYEMLTVTATGVVAGAAGGAAYTWWTGTGVLAGATAGGISVGVSAFVTYNMGYFWGWFS